MLENAYIEFKTHAVTITKTDEEIRCFKFTAPPKGALRCSYEVFTSESDATEFIVSPFPIDWYEVSFQE